MSNPSRRADMFVDPENDPREAPRHFSSEADPDGDFDGAVPDPKVVAEAWDAWRAEMGFTDRFVAEAPNLEVTGESRQGPVSLREVLVHMVRSTHDTPATPTWCASGSTGGSVRSPSSTADEMCLPRSLARLAVREELGTRLAEVEDHAPRA